MDAFGPERRSAYAAHRLRNQLGLAPGDRLLTLASSTPALPALYFGAMRAGVVLVPLDVRMAPDVIARIAASSGARALAAGAGLAQPALAELSDVARVSVESLVDEPDAGSRAAWHVEIAAWPAAGRGDVFEIVYTSGTTGRPKGVVLTHGNVLSWVESCLTALPAQPHRIVSLIPLSHVFAQLAELFYALSVGASVLYVRSLQPRTIFEALRSHRVTTMAVVPAALELFKASIEREAERRGAASRLARLRGIARRLPFPLRRILLGSVHRALGGQLGLLISSGAHLPPAVQEFWEDLGVLVLQGYGATECGIVTFCSRSDHPAGAVGRAMPPGELALAADGEVVVRGPGVFAGYWNDPEATAAAFDEAGFYRTGDLGRLDERKNLVLMGRKKDMVVLPNGFNVYPEDVENALREAGIAASVVLETAPGRLEAVVLAPAAAPAGSPASDAAIDVAVREANRRLSQHQRVHGWRRWPEEDFPRGDPSGDVFVVHRGLVKALIHDEGGHELLLSLVGRGQFFGELTLFERQLRESTVVSVLPTTVLQIARDDCLRVLERNPKTMYFMFERLADTIHRLSDSLEGIASTRVTVNKTLAEFERRGLIRIEKRRMEILDEPGLLREIRR